MLYLSSLRPKTGRISRRPLAAVLALIGPWQCIVAAPDNGSAITPRASIVLFNGRDLSGFYTWLGLPGAVDPNKKHHGRNDPDRVFTVVDQIDGATAIRISGQHWGGLVTKERYANYRLVAEYRWGNLTWGPRKKSTRDSGILLHCQGEDGSYKPDFRGTYMRSIEFQILEGGTGDMILVMGYERGAPKPFGPALKATVDPATKRWDPDGTLKQFGHVPNERRIYWRHKDPDYRNVTGFRGRADAEKPVGEWNVIEAICDGGSVAFIVNGQPVNGGSESTFQEGKILFQSEGAEIFFRRIELHPLSGRGT